MFIEYAKVFLMTGYMSVREASEKWGASERWVQILCSESRIEGVIRFGRSWAIPKDAEKPADGRTKLVKGSKHKQKVDG